MLGTFRFILALLVALSHADVRIAGLNPGVVAVICFYLISGYVMTGLLRNHYADLQGVPRFYLDRVLRLFPQYLVIGAATLAWFVAAGTQTAFLRHAPGWSDLLANLAVVPLNYYMFNGSDSFTLIPPAWSLGAEIQFYLLIPLLLIFRLRIGALAIGVLVFGCASWGLINSDYFGYRLLPGVLTFFLLGSCLYDAPRQSFIGRRGIVIAGVLAAAIGAATLSYFDRLELPYNRETLLGLAIGLPLLHVLGGLPQRRWDNILGDLSYGVFLNHFLVQWVWGSVPVGAAALTSYLGISIAISALTQQLFERPVLNWRRRLRRPVLTENRIAETSIAR